MLLPAKRISGRHQLDGGTVLGVELRVPSTMTLHQRVFLRLDVQRTTDVALVVPDHHVTLQLMSQQCNYGVTIFTARDPS